MMAMLQQLKGQIVVSCQAYEGEALFGSVMMAAMAQAAKDGGAAGIRANSPADIRAIRQQTGLPVIGIWKREYADSEVYISPTLQDVLAICEAGAEIVAMDATSRPRPNQERLTDIVAVVRSRYPKIVLMADISTYEEGLEAERLGFDIVATTLSGYTPYSRQQEGPDYEMLKKLIVHLGVPVAAEGKIQHVDEANRCFALGAHMVIIGSAITRPQLLTRSFVTAAEQRNRCNLEA